MEFFSGHQAVTNALRDKEFVALPYERDLDSINMDWNSAPGYALAIQYILRLKRGGLCMLAPVCSSWGREVPLEK